MTTANAESVTRPILGGIPDELVYLFYLTTTIALAVTAAVFVKRIRIWLSARGQSEREADHLTWRAGIGRMIGYAVSHKLLLKDPYAGIAHLLTFYGFAILFAGTCLVFLEHQTPLHFFYGPFYQFSSLVIDLGGAALIVGLTMFLVRRHGLRPTRLLRDWRIASLAWLLLAIGITGFLLEAARIADDFPPFERWSIVGYSIACVISGAGIGGESLRLLHQSLWAVHAVLCVGFLALLPWHFFGHIAYGTLSWARRTARPIGQLKTPDIHRPPGAVSWQDFGWADLMQADACTTCGRCNEVCPAATAGTPLRPREIVQSLRMTVGSTDIDPSSDLSVLVGDDEVWSCTTCGACNSVCPVGIEVYDKIVDLRRGRVEQGDVPERAADVFDRMIASSTAFGGLPSQRMAWAAGLDAPVAKVGEPIETLYWIGCAGSFDVDGQAVARSMIKILNHLGAPYKLLGDRESCTGDPARRMGEEGLFQESARRNVAMFESHNVKRVLTHCAHCFNTFQNEYPQFGGRFEVEHHSSFLDRMIREGALRIEPNIQAATTYHDPCYLARANGMTESPRRVLESATGQAVSEMERHGANTFCCGAGGGAMWLDVRGQERVENVRIRQAAATGATTIATACPFCKSMLQAGADAQEGENSPRIRDLAELVVESMGL
jgi:Fe-S oxidoreductase